jgi:hypothetical protein
MARKKRAEERKQNVRGAAPQTTGDNTTENPDRGRIAGRAYELYLARGAEDGRAMDDWLSAEQELSKRGRTSGKP